MTAGGIGRLRARDVAIAMVAWLTAASSVGLAEKIAPGSDYWPVLKKLEGRRGGLEAMETACRQLEDLEDALLVAERASKPVVPALEGIEKSRMIRAMGKAPEVGPIVETAHAAAAATRVGIQGLAWVHQADEDLVRPLTEAVTLSNRVLEERDDGDMPALIGAYRQSAQALGRADSRLTENIEQTSEMLRLVEKTQELLQDTGRADPKFMASLKQFGSAVDDLLNQEQAAQEQVREAGSLAGEVVQAAPRKRRPTASEGRKAAPTEAAKEGSSPAAGRPPSGEEASTPGVTPEGTSPAGEPAASAPSPAGPAADREPQAAPSAGRTGNPWVFLGGVAVLAAGAGLLAWVIARLIATRDGSSRGGPRRSV